MTVDDAAGVGIGLVDAAMQRQRLAGAVAVNLFAGRVDARQTVRLQRAQAGVSRRDQEAAVAESRADVADGGVRIASLEKRAPHTTNFDSKLGVAAHLSTRRAAPRALSAPLGAVNAMSLGASSGKDIEGAAEEVHASEIARLQRQMQASRAGGFASRVAPGHAGVDLLSDPHPRDAKRLHAGARGLATGNDKLAPRP